MKKFFYYIIVFTFFSYKTKAQNLVPNPSFEEHYECQMSIQFLKYWYAPDASNPDYFNACAPANTWMSVPLNTRGYQYAHSGDAYIFFGTNISDWFKIREHFAVKLRSPLIRNNNYCVKFYVSLAETGGWAMDDIGAYFSVGSIDTTGMGTYLINYKPQISNPRGNIIMDTANWILVEGSFIAQGGEDHITIGSFLPIDSISYRDALVIRLVGRDTLLMMLAFTNVTTRMCQPMQEITGQYAREIVYNLAAPIMSITVTTGVLKQG